MDLQMDITIAKNYKSKSQIIRVMSEAWVKLHIFCPCCGNSYILNFPNNKPVADFYCPACNEEFELKSKTGCIGDTIADGAYETMISRIQSTNNPNFFFMSYNKKDFRVQNLLVVPKHFFTASIIERRKPLAATARRAGWVGCNISIKQIPNIGKIYLVRNEQPLPISEVVHKYQKTAFAANYKANMRGWMLDVLNCIERIESTDFSLETMYSFEDKLQLMHPHNHHVKEKIRQQLQILRDHGLLEFSGRGSYKKLF